MEHEQEWREFESVLPDIIAAAKTDDDRPAVAFAWALQEHYCIHCGTKYGETDRWPCQCNNDE